MKEILYVQAGSFANFIGTHFWNTQESYFTYGEDEEPAVYHDKSFREGLTSEVKPQQISVMARVHSHPRESRHTARDF